MCVEISLGCVGDGCTPGGDVGCVIVVVCVGPLARESVTHNKT